MRLSIVDLSCILPGKTRHDAFMHSVDLVQYAEQLGYTRYWVAEHHGGSIGAGRAPEVLIPALAAVTKSIRIGSGGVLLNHYSPFKVAEVFCTLHELYPSRIDLGVGRATTGPVYDLALQQDRSTTRRADSNEQLSELVAWLENDFPPEHPFAKHPLRTDAPPDLYVLGSSSWSAEAAATRGLKYVMAGFINQQGTPHNIGLYHRHFAPHRGLSSEQQPEVILAVHVVCADDDDEARRQLAPVHVMYNNLAQGNISAPLLSPDDAVDALGGLPDLQSYTPGSGIPPRFIGGSLQRVQEQLQHLANDLAVDEIMIQDVMTDYEARRRSYELLSQIIT